MQRPTEKDFTHYAYNQPPKDVKTRETFDDLVTRTVMKTIRQEQSQMTDVDLQTGRKHRRWKRKKNKKNEPGHQGIPRRGTRIRTAEQEP